MAQVAAAEQPWDIIRKDVLATVEKDGRQLAHCTPEFQADKAVVLAAVTQHWSVYETCL